MEPGVSIHYSQEPATCPYSQLAQYIPCLPFHVFKIRFDIMLLSTPRSQKLYLSFRFPHRNTVAPALSPVRATCPANLILLDLFTRMIFVKECLKPCIMQYSSHHSYVATITPKYVPQHHPILIHPQPMFMIQYKGLTITAKQNNKQNYNYVYINSYIFGEQTERQEILHRMIENIP